MTLLCVLMGCNIDYDTMILSETDWKERLTSEQYFILREAGTEAPFTNAFDKHFEEGGYSWAGCGELLFRSTEKFDSGCGWPAFTMPWNEESITKHEDNTLGMKRIEVRCANCEGHLGHVFEDGPPPTGTRYCINSGAMKFASAVEGSGSDKWEVATFGGG